MPPSAPSAATNGGSHGGSRGPFADVRLKRQVIRWLIQKQAPLTHDILDVLRVLLTDRDWEVRMSAMFATGRLTAAPLRSLVDRTPVPDGSAEGLDTRDIHTLVAARRVIVAHLNGLLTPDEFDASLERMPGIPPDFARAVIGWPVPHVTRDTVLIHALTVPADTQVPHPAQLPPGLVAEEGRYFLADTDIEFVWISPIDHWLGDDPELIPTPNPIRLVAPERGFFIAQYPLTALRLSAFDSSTRDIDDFGSEPQSGQRGEPTSLPPIDLLAKPDYLTMTLDAGQELCAALSTITGATLRLPEADEWEMAARGPDGRRYPSGNGLDRDMLLRESPWGIHHATGVVPQWTQSRDNAGNALICGKALRCAARELAPHDMLAAIRPVIPAAELD